MKIPQLRLKKDQERRLVAGHLWIYGNEVDTDATPLNNLEPGQPVEIWGGRERWLGLGYVNPKSLICARLVTRRRGAKLDVALLQERISVALALRDRFYPGPWYRLIFGESDGLPGLVVDRYGDILVLQITTAGMERLREQILTTLDALLKPKAVLLRNDIPARELEGLPQQVEIVRGTVPEWVELQENGVKFLAAPEHGQKTGWFYDQAESRAKLQRYLSGKRVLDVCSYLGGWGISAAVWGAKEVICLDSSEMALNGVIENAKLNGCTERVRTLKGDAFDTLKRLDDDSERFDVVVLDPPAFIKRRKDLEHGTEAYERINRLGLNLLSPNGILATSSCSSLFSAADLLHAVQKGARRNNQAVQWLESGQQGIDHPIHPAIVETAYLQSLYLRVVADW